jgi:HlyD family secretion protein
MKKNLVLPMLAIAALCFAVVSMARTHPNVPVTAPPAIPPQSSYAERIAAIGLVEANTENIALGSHLSGVVERVYVTAGQNVQAGEPLVKLDTRHLDASLLRARAEVSARKAEAESARARVTVAEAKAAEARELLQVAREAGARSIAAEELTRRASTAASANAEIIAAKATAGAAEAAIRVAEAAARQIETDLERSTVTAPVTGTVLQINARPGESVTAASTGPAWLMIGAVDPLHVRADVDEHEAWRVRPGAAAAAHVRGNAQLSAQLRFVRFEPFILPKRSLTGDSAERVDTRVLQVIYAVEKSAGPLFVGQQLDVFIDAAAPDHAIARNQTEAMR